MDEFIVKGITDHLNELDHLRELVWQAAYVVQEKNYQEPELQALLEYLYQVEIPEESEETGEL